MDASTIALTTARRTRLGGRVRHAPQSARPARTVHPGEPCALQALVARGRGLPGKSRGPQECRVDRYLAPALARARPQPGDELAQPGARTRGHRPRRGWSSGGNAVAPSRAARRSHPPLPARCGSMRQSTLPGPGRSSMNAPAARGHLVEGDATVTIDDFDQPAVDVASPVCATGMPAATERRSPGRGASEGRSVRRRGAPGPVLRDEPRRSGKGPPAGPNERSVRRLAPASRPRSNASAPVSAGWLSRAVSKRLVHPRDRAAAQVAQMLYRTACQAVTVDCAIVPGRLRKEGGPAPLHGNFERHRRVQDTTLHTVCRSAAPRSLQSVRRPSY